MNESEAVRALKKDDKAAFGYLFRCYYDRLVAYITTYTHDKIQSEDIVQQAFINLWEDRMKLDPERSPKNYLYTIARNRYIDSVKKEKKYSKLLDELWEKALRERITEDSEQLERRAERIKKVMESLPPKCREIVRLNKMEGIKYKDIAVQMDISIKTVESQMRIAFQKIREAFKDDHLVIFIMTRVFRKKRRSTSKKV
ncbi:RNA polymerase sigma factor [Sinomicrobium sp. M5D2P9]